MVGPRLNRTHTAVLERSIWIETELVTEPHEIAWAGHARWFVHVLECDADVSFSLLTEISPEGLTWCEHETSQKTFRGPGMKSLPIHDPPPYARLRLKLDDPGRRIKAIIYLTLKQ